MITGVNCVEQFSLLWMFEEEEEEDIHLHVEVLESTCTEVHYIMNP